MRSHDLRQPTITQALTLSAFAVWSVTLFALVAPDAHSLKAPGAPGRVPARMEPSKE
jgi:hypothetical protein